MPSQGFHSLQATKIPTEENSDSIRFKIDSYGGDWTYTAHYCAEDNRMRGTIFLGSMSLPLQLRPVKAESMRPPRPQTPEPPYLYREWEVEFPGGSTDVRLSGSITAPKGRKKVPGVVLLSGSGPHNRDGEQFYHKTFLVLADALTRRGFAVLRYDERGVGESTGTYAGTTIEESAQDAKAAINALRSDPALRVDEVYVIGHSQGSLEAQMVAAQDDASVAGVVLLGGVGLNGVESSKARYRAMLRARGITEEKAKPDLFMYDNSYEIAGGSPDSAIAVARLRKWHEEIELDPKYSHMYTAPFVERWLFQFLHFDPSAYLQQIKVPVFAVSGGMDSQVDVERELEAVEAGLKRGGNLRFGSVVLPGMNHFMQTAKTGTYDEPYVLEETFSPAALQEIGEWLEKQAKEKSGSDRKEAK